MQDRLIIVALAGGLLLGSGAGHALAQPAPPVIAILTLQNLRPDPGTDWVGEGAAETVATKLAALDSVVIVERSRIREVLQEQDLQQLDLTDPQGASRVGRLLAAQRVLVGTYVVQGENVLFNARLVDVETAEILQTASLTAAMDGIFDAFYQLADAVIRSFERKVEIVDARPQVVAAAPAERIELSPQDQRVLREEARTTPQALEAYSRGVAAPRVEDQIKYFSLAIQFDRNYTPALVARGDRYIRINRIPSAEADFRRALAVSPRCADAWFGQARVYERTDRSLRAASAYERVITLARPSHAGRSRDAGDKVREIKRKIRRFKDDRKP